MLPNQLSFTSFWTKETPTVQPKPPVATSNNFGIKNKVDTTKVTSFNPQKILFDWRDKAVKKANEVNDKVLKLQEKYAIRKDDLVNIWSKWREYLKMQWQEVPENSSDFDIADYMIQTNPELLDKYERKWLNKIKWALFEWEEKQSQSQMRKETGQQSGLETFTQSASAWVWVWTDLFNDVAWWVISKAWDIWKELWADVGNLIRPLFWKEIMNEVEKQSRIDELNSLIKEKWSNIISPIIDQYESLDARTKANIDSLLPYLDLWVWVGGAKTIWKTWIWEIAEQWIRDVASKIPKPNIKIPNIPKPMKNIIDKSIEWVEWMTKAKKQALMDNPYQEIWAKAIEKLDWPNPPVDIKDLQLEPLRDLMEDVDNAIDTIKKQKWEWGEIFNLLRSDPTKIDTTSLLKNINNEIEWTNLTIDRIIKKIDPENILKSNNIIRWQATKSEIHDFRQALDKRILAENNKIIQWKAPAWWLSEKLKNIRWHVDNMLKSDPNRQQADAERKKIVEDINTIEEWITYREARKKWQLKDNIDNILLNINKPAKAQLLQRLEQFVPWISQRVEMISSIPDIAKSYQEIPKWLWAAIWWWVIWSFWWFVWTILWFASWFFGNAWLSIVRRNAIKKAITTLSPKAKKDIKLIQQSIKKWQANNKANKIRIDNIKKEIKANIPNSDKELIKVIDKLNTSIFLKSEWPLESRWYTQRLTSPKREIKEINLSNNKTSNAITNNNDMNTNNIWINKRFSKVKTEDTISKSDSI